MVVGEGEVGGAGTHKQEYPRIVGQLKKVLTYTHNGNTEGEEKRNI